MSAYVFGVFVHVAAAAALVAGSVVAAPAVRAAVRRARTTEELRAFLSIGRPLSWLTPTAALVVLASGVYLASAAHFWMLGWVRVAVASWIVSGIAAALVNPAVARVDAEAAAAADRAVGQRLDALRWSPRWTWGGDVMMASDAAMLYLMTVKPGLAGSLLALAAANAVVLAVRVVARPSRSAARRHDRDPVAAAETDAAETVGEAGVAG